MTREKARDDNGEAKCRDRPLELVLSQAKDLSAADRFENLSLHVISPNLVAATL